jgi:hypothetical protein
MTPRNYLRGSYFGTQGARTPQFDPLGRIEQGKTLDEATVFLVKHIDKNQDAIANIIRKRRNSHRHASLKNFAYHCLEELGHFIFADQVLPRNVALRDRVFHTLEMSGRTYIAGSFRGDRQPDLTHIHLNGRLLQPRPLGYAEQSKIYDHIMATLLHHMIHAYFLVACGPQQDGKEIDGRLKHQEHFACIMYKIRELSGRYDDPLPIGFGHTIPLYYSLDCGDHEYKKGYRELGRRGYNSFSRSNQYYPNQCSTCLAHMDEIPEIKIKDWYQNKCIKAVDPDIFEIKGRDPRPVATPLSKCPDKKHWIEIVYKKQIYRVDRVRINKFRSFKTQFAGDKRTLVVPDGLEPLIFTCFMHYLDRNDYLPDIHDANGISSAPVIGDRLYESQESLKTDVKVHRLATFLEFTDLRAKALERLRSYPVCLESPFAILEEIYAPGHELNVELRTWAIEFMKYSQPEPGQHPTETSNWKKLNENLAFQELLLCHTDYAQLRFDFDKAGEELRALKAAPLPPPPPPPPSLGHDWHLTSQYTPPPWYNIPPQAQIEGTVAGLPFQHCQVSNIILILFLASVSGPRTNSVGEHGMALENQNWIKPTGPRMVRRCRRQAFVSTCMLHLFGQSLFIILCMRGA